MSNPTRRERLANTSVKATNLKCFGTTLEGFEQILPINVLIGRNNAGKSTLLDLIAAVIDPYRRITWTQQGKDRAYHDIDLAGLPAAEPIYFQNLIKQSESPFHGRRFKRLAAERNILTEPLIAGAQVQMNGAGATQALLHFLTSATRDKHLITGTFLRDLNKIFAPDAVFTVHCCPN